jgi:hypothetical protein
VGDAVSGSRGDEACLGWYHTTMPLDESGKVAGGGLPPEKWSSPEVWL